MSKYSKLTDHLRNRKDAKWVASFEDVEQVLGFQLPPSARKFEGWWANIDKTQGRSWLTAGWTTKQTSIADERVTFIKACSPSDRTRNNALGGVVARAKVQLAGRLGVDPNQIDIVVRA